MTPQQNQYSLIKKLCKNTIITTLLGSLVFLFAACSSSDNTTSQGTADNSTYTLVASTTIWGDIAQDLTQNLATVSVKTLADNSEHDPHDYEPSASDILAIEQADLLLYNGGGYDTWFEREVTNNPSATVISAIQDDHTLNPHIWFDIPTLKKVISEITTALTDNAQLNAEEKTQLEDNTHTLTGVLDSFSTRIAALPAGSYVITETIADFLFEQSALSNVTPESYMKAITSETEPSAAAITETIDVLDNTQNPPFFIVTTSESATGSAGLLVNKATVAQVPAFVIAETPDHDQSFLEYFDATLTQAEELTSRPR